MPNNIKFDDHTFKQVARVLNVVNRDVVRRDFEGKEQNVLDYMKDETRAILNRNPECDYWGTMGFYIRMYPSDKEGEVCAEAVLMPYAVDSWLKRRGYYEDA